MKSLASGTIGIVDNALYTVNAKASAIIKSITIINEYDGDVILNLYKKTSTGSFRISGKNLSYASGHFSKDDTEYTMGPGDQIRAISDVADALVFVIDGDEILTVGTTSNTIA